MPKSFRKYHLKFISLLLISAFIFSNIMLCQFLLFACNLVSESACVFVESKECESEAESSCCMESLPVANDMENGMMGENCCCEIKLANRLPAEIPKNSFELQKFGLVFLNYIGDVQSDLSHSNSLILRVLSFHSPPKEDIHILNSNLRI